MVWFQCEDCGENLKKPKLTNHFRICSANKLSCIDCGQTFGQQTVQSHTQCITEAEKYGPKGQVKVSNGATPKSNNDSKQKPEVDINVGLTERAPWFCSLCNTKATSRQTLLLHADGKKHRAKARAFHAAKQPPKQPEESTPNSKVPTETKPNEELISKNDMKEPEKQDLPKSSDAENGNFPSKKKRKHDATEIDGVREKILADVTGELGRGEVIQPEREKSESKAKKAKHNGVLESNASKDTKKKIKWKKLITSVLKSNPDGVLKIRKLRKLVLKDLRESGRTDDETQLCDMLEQKINSSSRFIVDNMYVRLVS